ncbi:beta-propeller fold lactonase family protein [Rhodococcus triatomae]
MALWHVYVGGVTEDVWQYHPRPNPDTTIPARGIEHLLFDDSSYSLVHKETTEGDLFSPQNLVLNPNTPVLYAAEFAVPGRLVSFEIGCHGRLERGSSIETHGAMAISASVHPKGTRIYVGHLGDGVISMGRIDTSGMVVVTEPVVAPASLGSKVHHVCISPCATTLLATDFGLDQIVSYPLNDVGDLSPEPISRVTLPAGCAPRQVEVHPSGKYVYTVGVGDCHLYVLEAEDFIPRRIIARYPIGPLGLDDIGSAAETSMSLDASRLFVGVRGADSLSTFDLDVSGLPTRQRSVPSLGRSPRSIEVAPSGRSLLVGNWHSNRVEVFSGADSDSLHATGGGLAIPSPSSFVFVPS